MSRDIEKLIETIDIPEMEYVKRGRGKAVTITREEQVPEIVLPKTKAEEYEEARERLNRKTTAASKAYDPSKRKKNAQSKPKAKEPSVKTVELDSAASAAIGSASNVKKLKKRMDNLRNIVEEPKWVGAPDEIIPFAWRNPLITVPRPSKLYRAVTKSVTLQK